MAISIAKTSSSVAIRDERVAPSVGCPSTTMMDWILSPHDLRQIPRIGGGGGVFRGMVGVGIYDAGERERMKILD